MLKIKICLTVFFIYEIIAVMLLHAPNSCVGVFGLYFCADTVYKYFIMCAAVPMVAMIIGIWVREIVRARARRKSLLYRAGGALRSVAKKVGGTISENISESDLEKVIVAALVTGINRYMAHHTDTQNPKDGERDDQPTARGKKHPAKARKNSKQNS